MKKKIEFSERQTAFIWWATMIMLITNVLVFVPMVSEIISGTISLNESLFMVGFMIFMLLITLATFLSNLSTYMDSSGVVVKFSWFMFRPRFVSWDEVESATVRSFSAMSEFGGYGVKTSLNWKKKGYIVKSKMGFELKLKSGKIIFVSTQFPDEVEKILIAMGKMEKIGK